MITIKRISPNETYKIRHLILRQGYPITHCAFESDLLESTCHIGLFDDTKLIGISSLFASDSPLFSIKKQYQLRGMAILKAHQEKGYGHLIIKYCETLLEHSNTNLLWCNARETATNFYIKNGFQIIGKPFNIETVGMHSVMYKKL